MGASIFKGDLEDDQWDCGTLKLILLKTGSHSDPSFPPLRAVTVSESPQMPRFR